MKKVVFLPLDERPCNSNFPVLLFGSSEFSIVQPKKLGYKKQPADTRELQEFLLQECKDADGLVVALDTLLYGGLIPSRLHHLDSETVQNRLDTILQLRQNNPNLRIFAFQTIMRCPSSSISDEEPDYYNLCGREIWELGELRHRVQLGLAEESELAAAESRVPAEYLNDYLERRRFNLGFLFQSLQMVRNGVFDAFVIPQDDSSPYGFTAMDQQLVRDQIAKDRLQTRVLMYPGADELGCTMMSRMALTLANIQPRVCVHYSSGRAPFVTPLYEDRPLGETIRYQLLAAGFQMTDSQSDADLMLAVNCPSGEMQGAFAQPCRLREYTVERSLPAFVSEIRDCVQNGMPVAIADVAFLNGGDLELVQMLDQEDLLLNICGYAGWNTSSNTLGTAIAQGAHFLLEGQTPQHQDFLLLRYLEDAGYCSDVRRYIYEEVLEKLGYSYFDTRSERGELSQMIHDGLVRYARSSLSSIADSVEILDCWHPWQRMFEVGLSVRLRR